MKKFTMGVAVICSVLVLAGGVWRKTLRWRVPPMTGAGLLRAGCQSGIEIAYGMKPTGMGKKVEFVIADTKSDKIEAANAMSRLIERGQGSRCDR